MKCRRVAVRLLACCRFDRRALARAERCAGEDCGRHGAGRQRLSRVADAAAACEGGDDFRQSGAVRLAGIAWSSLRGCAQGAERTAGRIGHGSSARRSVGEGGYQRIQMSMAREPVLSALQKAPEGQALRDPSLFYITIFGTPSATTPWGWTFEGHHISTHFTVRGNQVSAAPMFLGSQPNDLPAARLEGTAAAAAKDSARVGGSDHGTGRGQGTCAGAVTRRKAAAIAVFDRTEKRDADMLSGINTRRVTPFLHPGLPRDR